ncbi:MAG TPA: branched-chain amino acid ABC transporter permease, partial [Thermodesulfobacteriota bacterium]|nr:branched-chain amino acid ABC transporter permease [Thermodesulfobacteriota bacterium]
MQLDFATLLIICLHGLVYGVLIFLVASGLSIVFGMMGVLNLA